MVDVLFAAHSFDDLVTQLNLMERLGNSDVDTVKSIAAYEQDIKDRRVKLDADKKAAAKLVTVTADQKAEVESLQGKLEQMTAGIKADIQRLQQQAAARAKAAADAAAAQNNPGGGTGGGGGGTVVDPGGSGHSSVVGIAQGYLGVPYVYGGASPRRLRLHRPHHVLLRADRHRPLARRHRPAAREHPGAAQRAASPATSCSSATPATATTSASTSAAAA